MSNKHFFKYFFTGNPIWNQIQTNPVAHQYLFPHKIPHSAHYHLTNRAGNRIPTNARYHQSRRYHPNPEPRRHTRVMQNHISQLWGTFPHHIKTQRQAREYVVSEHEEHIPAVGAHLLSHRAAGLTAVQRGDRSLDNAMAMMGKGWFELKDWEYTNDDDYWLPFYEGDFEEIPEKQTKRKSQHYNRHAKFLGQKPYITPKQKAALVWLEMR